MSMITMPISNRWIISGVKSSMPSWELEEALGGAFAVEERMLRLRRVVVRGEGVPMGVIGKMNVQPFDDVRGKRKTSKVVMLHVCGWKGTMELATAVEICEIIDFPLYLADRVFIAPEASTDDYHHREDTRIIYISMDTQADAEACLKLWDAHPITVSNRTVYIHCTQLAQREYRSSCRNQVFKIPQFWKPPPLLEEEELSDEDYSSMGDASEESH
eukprot:TRINITY_DN9941_c1_g1_i1.p1 TRINITY_DN9941_c1_g1~~TRINITY_DN9941_c1_g1_i1.p1  ORF type:complete len:239 (+),score=78.00 TRINITY_DN9941_c1_g1_i1:72-719(+)